MLMSRSSLDGPFVEELFADPMIHFLEDSMPRSDQLDSQRLFPDVIAGGTHIESDQDPSSTAFDYCEVVSYAPASQAFIHHDCRDIRERHESLRRGERHAPFREQRYVKLAGC